MTFGELFSGIGGFRIGLERAGHECKWACEMDPFCRSVYRKHWPDTKPFYEDIRDIEDPPYVDMLCGGFPCQDLSVAGKQAGIDGARSGLWSEFARLIRTVRPRIAFVENVPGLLVHGMERVLGDLAEIGYDAEWDCIPASAVGAPHRRDRVWIVAYSRHGSGRDIGVIEGRAGTSSRRTANPDTFSGSSQQSKVVANAERVGESQSQRRQPKQRGRSVYGREDVADAERKQDHSERGVSERRRDTVGRQIKAAQQDNRSSSDNSPDRCGQDVADTASVRPSRQREPIFGVYEASSANRETGWLIGERFSSQWATEPDMGRVAHGVPNRVDRLKSLGNAVVPQVVEWIGRRMMECEEQLSP